MLFRGMGPEEFQHRRNFMKLSQFGRISLAAVVLTVMSLSMTACSVGHTIEFLYVTTAKATSVSSSGFVYAYKVDAASGTLTTLPDSPFPSGGRNPVAEVVSPSGLFLYVVNHDDSDIVENAIGTDGKIYAQCTYNIPNSTSYPTSVAIDPAGKFLLVAFTYQPGYTDSVPGPGGVTVFPILPNSAIPTTASPCTTGPGTLGTPVTNPALSPLQYFPVGVASPVSGLSPDSITVTAGEFVYVSASGQSIPSPGITQIISTPQVFGFSLNTTTGVLTAAGTTSYAIGALPSAVTSDTTGKYLYVTDQQLNKVYAYTIGSGGALTAITGSPYATGNGADALAIDSTTTPHYLYVANYTDNTISSYSISSSTGALTALPQSSATNSTTGSNPVGILVDPAVGYYLYTANFLDGTVSGKQINTTNGGLINVQFTPFGSGGEPTAIAATTSAQAALSAGLSQVTQ
jgi:6-phosphogluconolactonase (cycloisomerase 2 family)